MQEREALSFVGKIKNATLMFRMPEHRFDCRKNLVHNLPYERVRAS